ncbi:hypothetical protein L1987_18611 [Smallanthus sonchifolius]|uniref:Uncharacterized protein n=1 Tax=Smallanthus sonchifolius TaxID=185202 RepID=A0ACB9J192_9ASTR|nr:hypothetical protein L1987_18611 [Smallanthus sonchifolius]
MEVAKQKNRVDGQRTMGFAKEETIRKAVAHLLRDIMPAAIAEAMKYVRKMLGKGRWVRAKSDEDPKEENIGEKITNDEGLGAEIESEEINPSKRHKQNFVEMECMKENFQQKGSCGKCGKRHGGECRIM